MTSGLLTLPTTATGRGRLLRFSTAHPTVHGGACMLAPRSRPARRTDTALPPVARPLTQRSLAPETPLPSSRTLSTLAASTSYIPRSIVECATRRNTDAAASTKGSKKGEVGWTQLQTMPPRLRLIHRPFSRQSKLTYAQVIVSPPYVHHQQGGQSFFSSVCRRMISMGRTELLKFGGPIANVIAK